MKLSINIDGADDVELLDVEAEEAPGMSLAALRGKIGKSPVAKLKGDWSFGNTEGSGVIAKDLESGIGVLDAMGVGGALAVVSKAKETRDATKTAAQQKAAAEAVTKKLDKLLADLGDAPTPTLKAGSNRLTPSENLEGSLSKRMNLPTGRNASGPALDASSTLAVCARVLGNRILPRAMTIQANRINVCADTIALKDGFKASDLAAAASVVQTGGVTGRAFERSWLADSYRQGFEKFALALEGAGKVSGIDASASLRKASEGADERRNEQGQRQIHVAATYAMPKLRVTLPPAQLTLTAEALDDIKAALNPRSRLDEAAIANNLRAVFLARGICVPLTYELGGKLESVKDASIKDTASATLEDHKKALGGAIEASKGGMSAGVTAGLKDGQQTTGKGAELEASIVESIEATGGDTQNFHLVNHWLSSLSDASTWAVIGYDRYRLVWDFLEDTLRTQVEKALYIENWREDILRSLDEKLKRRETAAEIAKGKALERKLTASRTTALSVGVRGVQGAVALKPTLIIGRSMADDAPLSGWLVTLGRMAGGINESYAVNPAMIPAGHVISWYSIQSGKADGSASFKLKWSEGQGEHQGLGTGGLHVEAQPDAFRSAWTVECEVAPAASLRAPAPHDIESDELLLRLLTSPILRA